MLLRCSVVHVCVFCFAFFALACLPCMVAQAATGAADPLDAYNVAWKTPSSRDQAGYMPIGNGDVGLNAWVEDSSDLLLLLSKTDAWSERGELLKLGRVRVSLSPNPFKGGLPFEQTLRLRQGEIAIRAGEKDRTVTLRVWVDANHPVIHVEVVGQHEFDVQARVELWRKNDTVLAGGGDRVAWCYRNETSNFRSRLEAHNLAGLEKTYHDPLLHRTFGAVMLARGMTAKPKRASALASAGPGKQFDIQIHVLCAQTPTGKEWLSRVEKNIEGVAALGLDATRTAHRAWWRDFWDRSWIRVTTSPEVGQEEPFADEITRSYMPTTLPLRITPTTVPLRIGASSIGYDRFTGFIARARVFRRALKSAEIKKLAGGVEVTLAGDKALLGDWRFSRLDGGAFPNQAGPEHPAKAVQGVEVAEFAGIKAAKLSGKGWIEIANHEDLNVSKALTLDAWIAPEHSNGSRIIDKIPAATSDGYLLDTGPGNSLRLIVKAGPFSHAANLPVKQWTHVAATFDVATGQEVFYVNGRAVVVFKPSDAAMRGPGSQGHTVSQGYTLQRFISGCGGRGAQPIKFNGTLFTFDHPEGKGRGGVDYRRWGPDYWLQNTRLVYWPMMAAGDFEMMQPFFRMYTESMPLQKERTQRYFGHAGAYYPETMSFWGLSQDIDYGTAGREGKPISWHSNPYIRREWQGGIEVLAMMLDYWAYTQDNDFLKEDLLPFAGEIITFYDKHYKRDDRGKILFHPAQALETWWDCTNPMPEIAGLRFVLPRLLDLPSGLTGDAQRKRWQRLLGELPPVPMRKLDDGQPILSFADKYANRRNAENPELYAVFPYRLYGVGKPGLEMARRSFANRINKSWLGWSQDETQMAYLGLAEQARGYLATRAATKFDGAKFPAFWGPNADWIPDQDHGGNLLMALQTMLLQTEGKKILLFPAWPKAWDVEFKLHAPLGTTVEGIYRAGKLRQLKVTPESRENDLEIITPVE